MIQLSGLSRQNVRLAARSFLRQPGFTAVAIISLALAIALNTTMYSVIDAMIAPKSNIRDADHVYALKIWGDLKGVVDPATRASLIRSAADLYEEITYVGGSDLQIVEYGRHYDRAHVAIVAPNYFHMIGVRPTSGRTFVSDDVAASTQGVVISQRIVESLFPDDDAPIGKWIDIEGVRHPVIGVVDTKSQLPGGQTGIWILPPPGTVVSSLTPNLIRLRKDVDVHDADKRLQVISARLAALARESPKYTWFQLIPINRPQFHIMNFHYALISAVIAVLLVACANLANLQLARGIGRSRELAVRTALGASRRNIIAQLVLESALLAVVGLVAGLIATYWGIHLLASRIPPSITEYVIAPQTSWRVLAFAMTACVLCVMLVGLLPAIRVSRVDPNELLKAGAGTGANKKNRRQYGMMVVAEIGLSLALLSGAALVVRSAFIVSRVMRTEYDLTPLSSGYLLFRPANDTAVSSIDFRNQLLARIRALPDVEDAAMASYGGVQNQAMMVSDASGTVREVWTPAYSYRVVTPTYLRTMGMPVLAGRDFLDGAASESEVIVDKKTARVLWPGSDPIGQQIKLGDHVSTRPWLRVVGVVKESSDMSRLYAGAFVPDKAAHLGYMYTLASTRDTFHISKRGMVVDVVVRSRSDHDRMPVTLTTGLKDMAPFRLLGAVRMDEALGIRRARESHDFVAATFSAFAALAMALAALGIYGIVAHAVAERRRELGVRIALGASGRNILHVVLREGNAVALAGVALGLLFTKYTVSWLIAFTAEDDRYDAPLFAAMGAVLFTVAVVSALIPAMRATRIDPVESMRSE